MDFDFDAVDQFSSTTSSAASPEPTATPVSDPNSLPSSPAPYAFPPPIPATSGPQEVLTPLPAAAYVAQQEALRALQQNPNLGNPEPSPSQPAANAPAVPQGEGADPNAAPVPSPAGPASAQAAPPPPPDNPNIIELSTRKVDTTGMTPKQIQAMIDNDNILRRYQSENSILKRGANPQVNPTTNPTYQSQLNGQQAVPAPLPPPVAPAVQPPDFNAQLEAAWEAYNENPNAKTMQGILKINEEKTLYETDAKYRVMFEQAMAPVKQMLAPIAEERIMNARAAALDQSISAKVGELVSFGVEDCRNLPKQEIQAYFNRNAELLMQNAAAQGYNYDYNAVFDPAVMQELVALSVREALDARRAAAPQVSTPQPPPPVAPAVAGQTGQPNQPPQFRTPLPRPLGAVVPQTPGSQPAAHDPWGHVTEAHFASMDRASVINGMV